MHQDQALNATIRSVTGTDAEGLWSMLEPVFRAGDTYAIDPDISRDDALAYWTAEHAYMAENSSPLGTYYIRPNQPGGGDHICNCGYIVAPGSRGQGLAAAMCLASQDQARALGFTAMQFNFVLDSNQGALRLWHRLGFQTIGTIPDAFRHPTAGTVAAHILYKVLSPTFGN